MAPPSDPPSAGRHRPLAACRHCRRLRRLYPRHLCRRCWRDPAIRQLYPAPVVRRVWTRRDEQVLRQARSQDPPVPWPVLARLMGYRSWRSLASQAHRRGIPTKPYARVDVERLRDLVAAAHSRPVIARELGCSRGAVDWHCRRLRLQTQGRCTQPAERHRQHLQEVCSTNGWRSLGDASAEAGRIQAAQMGWPQAEGVLQARILQALLPDVPMSRRDLAVAVGNRLDSRGRAPHYLSRAVTRLHRRGLIVVVGYRQMHAKRLGRPQTLYTLAAGVVVGGSNRRRAKRKESP